MIIPCASFLNLSVSMSSTQQETIKQFCFQHTLQYSNNNTICIYKCLAHNRSSFYLSAAVDDGAFCFKRCPGYPFELDCFLNSTNVISYHFLTLPTITKMTNGSLTLFSLDSSSTTFYPNVKFEITDGNNEGLFSIIQEELYKG